MYRSESLRVYRLLPFYRLPIRSPVSDGPVSDGPVSDGPVSDEPTSSGPVSDRPAWNFYFIGASPRKT